MPRQPKTPKVLSHYRLGPLLGSGGMGSVYRAADRRDGRAVAVKLIHPHLAAEGTFRERFEREAYVGAVLRSPYTVHLLDYGVADGTYFLVTEFVQGQTLKDALAGGPLPVLKALEIAAKVARALAEAEWKEVIHRDIKPENILLAEGDSVKVYDFGVAKLVGGAALTVVGGFVGTLTYAAPEVAEGRSDNRSDIYSLGATLYYMLAGRPPFSGSIGEVLRHHRHTDVPLEPLSACTAPVVEIVKRCLEKDPDKRYQSAAELAEALEQLAAALRPPEPVATAPEPVAPVEEEPEERTKPVVEEPASTTEQVEALSPPPEPTPPPPEPTPPLTEPGGPPTTPPPTEPASPPPETPTLEPTTPERPPLEPTTPARPRGPWYELTTLSLGPARGGRLGSSLGWTSYQLFLDNAGDEPIDLGLSAWDSEGRCVFSLPQRTNVRPGGRTTVVVKVRPRVRHRGGKREVRNFTVSAADGGRAPPLVVTGSYEDRPYGWLLNIGGGLMGGGVAVGIAALVFAGGSGGNGNGPSPTPTALCAVMSPVPSPGETIVSSPAPTCTPEPSPVTPAPTPRPLQAGDCVTATFDADGGVRSVDDRPTTCDPGTVRYTGSFPVPIESDVWPGNEELTRVANVTCPSGSDYAGVPTEEAWENREREFRCFDIVGTPTPTGS